MVHETVHYSTDCQINLELCIRHDSPVMWGDDGEKTGENGEGFSYISCDFGLHSRRDPKQYAQRLEQLEEPLRNYILGIPWERKLSYHRLDERMRQIAVSLYESGGYKGSCYFVKTGEKVILGS